MITSVSPPKTLYRLGRPPNPWEPPDWAYARDDGTFGNRFDDPDGQYRVLYASSSRVGCFVETLARFRTDVTLIARLAEIEGIDDYVPLGVVPLEWRAGRIMGIAGAEGNFAAIGSAESLGTLRAALAKFAAQLDINDIDASAIRLSVPRAFTQAISSYIYTSNRFHGIAYRSRYGDDMENWAVFEPFAALHPNGLSDPLELRDPDFTTALAIHHLSTEEAVSGD